MRTTRKRLIEDRETKKEADYTLKQTKASLQGEVMEIPTYTGEPLSVLARVTDPESKPALWQWGPSYQPLTGDMDTINRLIAVGYKHVKQVPKHYRIAHLLSQCCDVVYVRDGEHIGVWTPSKDIAHVIRCPVTLVGTMENVISSESRIAILQFLPPPGIGEWALIPNEGKILSYHRSQLPEQAQVMAASLRQALLQLAGESAWPLHTELHALCMNKDTYQQAMMDRGKQEEANQIAIQLEQAHRDVEVLRQSWLQPDWLVQWTEIRKMTQSLADEYYRFHCEQTQQPQERRTIPIISDAFIFQQSSIWSALPFQAYPEAVSNAASGATRWTEDQVSERVFRVSYAFNKPSGTTTVHLQSPEDEKSTLIAKENVWKQVRKLGDLDGDIYLAIIVQLLNGTRDKNGWTWISAAKILDYRGIIPRTEKADSGKVYRAGHRQEDIEDIATCIGRMRNARITVDQAIYEEPQSGRSKRKSQKKTRFTRESPLFQFGDVIRKQDLWNDGSIASLPGEIAWQVKESAWMEPFIQGTNRAIGTLLQSCLKYDPYHETWEKRLSRYLMFHLRENRHSTTVTRKVGNLIEELSLDIDERNPARTKDRFEKALDRLKKDGHITQWHYQEDINLPARKWIETWKNQSIVFTAPVIIDGNITHGTDSSV